MTKLFKEKTSGRLVDVFSIEDGIVQFSNQGGGFVIKAPETEFMSRFEAVTDEPGFRKFVFTGEWLETEHVGYSNGYRWNGWAVPYVSLDVAKQIAEAMNEQAKVLPADDSYTFRWDGDTLIVFDPQESADVRVEPESIDTEDGTISLYDISMGFCWDFVRWFSDSDVSNSSVEENAPPQV